MKVIEPRQKNSTRTPASLRRGGWVWQEKRNEWHRLVWIKDRNDSTVFYPALLRRDGRTRQFVQEMSGRNLARFNRANGYEYPTEPMTR